MKIEDLGLTVWPWDMNLLSGTVNTTWSHVHVDPEKHKRMAGQGAKVAAALPQETSPRPPHLATPPPPTFPHLPAGQKAKLPAWSPRPKPALNPQLSPMLLLSCGASPKNSKAILSTRSLSMHERAPVPRPPMSQNLPDWRRYSVGRQIGCWGRR